MSKRIETVLFDAGGVLVSDAMQQAMFTRGGLVDKLGLDLETALQTARRIYETYKLGQRETTESKFWLEVIAAAGFQGEVSDEFIAEVIASSTTTNPNAIYTFNYLHDRGVRMGIVSNNTNFWHEAIATNPRLEIDSYMDPNLQFWSDKLGEAKPFGLLGKAALAVTTPERTLYIDNQGDNIQMARRLGFQVVLYSMLNDSPTLHEVVAHEL